MKIKNIEWQIRAIELGEKQTAHDWDAPDAVAFRTQYTLNYKLLEACVRNNYEKAVEAIEKGADVNVKNQFGYTALMIATYLGFPSIVELLRKYEADINIETKNITALDIATARANDYTEIKNKI